MLPVFRWCLCGLGALWSCAVWAQSATPQPEIDESKIPEWVKRQARSPYRVIIDSNLVKAKPAAPKEDAGAKTVAKKPPLKTAPPLAGNTDTSTTVSALPLVAPETAVETAAAPQLSVESTVAPAAAVVALSAQAAAAEPPPLTLLKRVEPVLTPELLDSRLNSAKVVVAFTVTASGEVSNVSIASTTDSRLNRAVLRALQAWRYAPIPEPREHRVSFAFATE